MSLRRDASHQLPGRHAQGLRQPPKRLERRMSLAARFHVVQILRAQGGATTAVQAMIPTARMRSARPDTELRAALEDILSFLRAARHLRGRA